MNGTFELFDHTADMGVRVRAETREDLVMAAIEGFYSTIGELVALGEEAPFQFRRRGDDDAVLLRDLLHELLILFERDKRKVTQVEGVRFSHHELLMVAKSSPIDANRSAFYREVKAVTYHELAIRRNPSGYEATFIVDI